MVLGFVTETGQLIINFSAMKRIKMLYRSYMGPKLRHILEGAFGHIGPETDHECAAFGSEFLNDSIRMVDQPIRQMID